MRHRALVSLIALALALPPAAHAGAAREEKKVGGPGYVAFQPLTATTDKGGGRRGVLSIECGLDIPDAALRERALTLLPRLRAAYLQTAQLYAGGLPGGVAPNPEFIGQALQRQTDVLLGRPGARVLLGAILLN